MTKFLKLAQFLKQCWQMRRTKFNVFGDNTDMPYTCHGERIEFEFIKTGFLRVWIWARLYTLVHSRGAVHFVPVK